MSPLGYLTAFGVLSVTDILCPSTFQCFPFCLHFLYLLCLTSILLSVPPLIARAGEHWLITTLSSPGMSLFTLCCLEPNITRPSGKEH